MRNLASLSLLIVPALALSSCRNLPEVPGTSVRVLYSEGGMSAKSPVDIVVAPVADESGTNTAPCDMLRSAFADGLVRRRYSPLSLDYVSSALEGQAIAAAEAGTPVPASYSPGTLGEDAVFRASVKGWDTSLWQTERKLGVTIDTWMIDSVDPLSQELWGARYEKTLDMALMQNNYPTESVLMNYCCEVIAAEILDCMPARTPRAGL
ncbi:MAG: hypothetical protein MK291_00730 [Planctomycetes bacterium]|nr:hypothetical protein [Planctomycetota bacterium]